MADANDVMSVLFPPQQDGHPPADTIVVYQGADSKRNGFTPWSAWDLRGWVRQLTWDLLRFRLIDEGKPNPDRTLPMGMYDHICRISFQTDRSEQMLKRICEKLEIDVTDLGFDMAPEKS